MEGIGNSLGVGGSQKSKKLYETGLKFPEGWGGLRKNPLCGKGMDNF